LEDVALVVGTQQNLSNLYSLDIYGPASAAQLAAATSQNIAGVISHSLHNPFKKFHFCDIIVEP